MTTDDDAREALAREAVRFLSALGGTMPGMKSIPRRRSKLVRDVVKEEPPSSEKSTSE